MNPTYPSTIFQLDQPAQLRQGEWRSDSVFLEQLQASWQRQYADYLGEKGAAAYIKQLRDEKRLFDHYDPLTIHAWVDERIVAISALRPLGGLDLITMLEVLPGYQGRGIGAQLLQAHCMVSEKIMAHVSIHQPGASEFYQKMGFHLLQRSIEMHDHHKLEFDVLARSNRVTTFNAR